MRCTRRRVRFVTKRRKKTRRKRDEGTKCAGVYCYLHACVCMCVWSSPFKPRRAPPFRRTRIIQAARGIADIVGKIATRSSPRCASADFPGSDRRKQASLSTRITIPSCSLTRLNSREPFVALTKLGPLFLMNTTNWKFLFYPLLWAFRAAEFAVQTAFTIVLTQEIVHGWNCIRN